MLNNIARHNGWHTFISMQGSYNLLYREEEREMIPYCQHVGIGLIPFAPLARGVLARPWSTPATHRETIDTSVQVERTRGTDVEREIVRRVEELALKRNVRMAAVACAWLLSKGAHPVVGLGNTERVDRVLEALTLNLTAEELRWLEEPYQPREVVGFLAALTKP
jgi:aryl-alcohol dehydrogenase-like predicted oxidoreductase